MVILVLHAKAKVVSLHFGIRIIAEEMGMPIEVPKVVGKVLDVVETARTEDVDALDS